LPLTTHERGGLFSEGRTLHSSQNLPSQLEKDSLPEGDAHRGGLKRKKGEKLQAGPQTLEKSKDAHRALKQIPSRRRKLSLSEIFREGGREEEHLALPREPKEEGGGGGGLFTPRREREEKGKIPFFQREALGAVATGPKKQSRFLKKEKVESCLEGASGKGGERGWNCSREGGRGKRGSYRTTKIGGTSEVLPPRGKERGRVSAGAERRLYISTPKKGTQIRGFRWQLVDVTVQKREGEECRKRLTNRKGRKKLLVLP